jgi:hypothetical protein
MTFLTTKQWTAFNRVHRQWFDDVAGSEIIWKKVITNVDRWGEGEAELYEEITLRAIISYNDFRTWPINIGNIEGTIDKESIYLLINKPYLDELGYINENGNFDIDPVLDRFLVNGQHYYPVGDTGVAQIYNTVGYFMIILSREPLNTGDPLR